MYFAVKEETNGGTTYTVKIGNTDVATGVTLANGTTYHFKVTYDGVSAVTAYIDETEYSGTVSLTDVGVLRGLHNCVARYNGAVTYDNIVVTKEVEAGSVEVPTASITAVDGINRTVTFACATDGVTFSYSTDGENFTEADDVVISENATLFVKATKGTKSATSEGLNFEAGTTITLNTPTWAKTAYDSSTGVSTVTLASDQSSKLLSPTATIYYSINGAAATAYTDAISVADGEVLTYYASAAGYTNSAEGSVTAVAPNSNATLWTESYVASADKQTITRDGDVVTTINTTDYYYMQAATDGRISERLLTYTANGTSNWLYRTGGIYGGAAQGYVVTGLKTGDYVTINFSKGDGNPVGNTTDATFDEWNSTSTSYKYNVTGSTGVFRFSIARYGYIKSITVQRAIATPGATVGTAGYATFASDVALDLSTLTEGFTAYIATGITAGAVTMTSTTDKVPAGTGLLIKGSGDFTITETRDETTAPTTNYLVGVTEDGVVSASTASIFHYVFAIQDDVVAFYNIASDANITAGKAYLESETDLKAAGARLAIVFENETSGISALKQERAADRYYDLTGRRISTLTKGLYIKNGKKVIK